MGQLTATCDRLDPGEPRHVWRELGLCLERG